MMNTEMLLQQARDRLTRGDISGALQLSERAARRGNNAAQFLAGQIYDGRGDGYREFAYRWYRKAALAGNGVAESRMFDILHTQARFVLQLLCATLALALAAISVAALLDRIGGDAGPISADLMLLALFGVAGAFGLFLALITNLLSQASYFVTSCSLALLWNDWYRDRGGALNGTAASRQHSGSNR